MMKSRTASYKAFLVCIACLLALTPVAAAVSENLVPDLEVYRRKIPESEAMQFLQQMGVGWNLGNTFDAHADYAFRDEMSIESSWVGVLTSEQIFDVLAQTGFRTVRIPASWHNHVNEDFIISEPWLTRVQQVVDWALSHGLNVILNTHHDVDPRYYYPSSTYMETSSRYIQSIWSQLAVRFADYDEHLIFESMNEPRLKDTAVEWNFDAENADCLDAAECINQLNQLFVDTVRASGGNNADRYLMIPAYDAAVWSACDDTFVLPDDAAENRLIVSVHAYTPYLFALDAGGTSVFSHEALSQSQEIPVFMNALYDKYIANGIPVVIGEFGARDKSGNLASRVDYAAYYTACASARNIPCLWWDNHAFSGNGEKFGLLDRRAFTWRYPEIVEAMMKYAGYLNIPEAPEN